MVSSKGKKNKSNELEDKVHDRRLLSKLECIEKLNKSCKGKNIFLIHNNNGMVNQYRELALLLENKYNVYGIQARGFKPGSEMAVSPWQMVDDYIEQVQALQKTGPYIIGGFCIGNNIAYEMAVRLEERGHQVGKLPLIDCHHIITDRSYRRIRLLKYLPAFVKKATISMAERTFKKEIQAKNYTVKHGDDDAAAELNDAETMIKEKVTKNMDILLRYILSFKIVKAPLLIPLAQDSLRPGSNQALYDRMTESKATVIHIPGVHNTILQKPYVERLAEVIINNL